jgi:hypothetical protein
MGRIDPGQRSSGVIPRNTEKVLSGLMNKPAAVISLPLFFPIPLFSLRSPAFVDHIDTYPSIARKA